MPWAAGSDSSVATVRRLRGRSLANLLRMGHCAPSIMQTLLDASDREAEWLVKLTAGLPGGIGNTGRECGGITAPLILLGLRHRQGTIRQGLPAIFDQGHDLLRRFERCNGTLLCSRIRGNSRLPLRCIGVIRRAPGLFAQTVSTDGGDEIRGERREAYCRLHAYCAERGFHCSHAVFQRLRHTIPVTQDLLDATSAFTGGTLFMGMTCSAFAAGVMALGAAVGKVERSRLRVLRMIAIMAAGGDAFADDLNAFNRIMNLGHRLSEWFSAEFGSTRCRAITNCDFSTRAGVGTWIEGDGLARCRAATERVAERVQEMIEQTRGGSRSGAESPPEFDRAGRGGIDR